MNRVVRALTLSTLLVFLGLGLWLMTRVLLPAQMEDAEHLEIKRDYLAAIASDLPVGVDQPNLVVILFDDLGPGDLSSYGSRAIRTPNIDRIAAAGARFANAYSPSPYCSASRAGLLTGRHPTRMGLDHVLQPAGTWQDSLLRIGARNRQLPAEEITLSEVLHSAGYATKLVGKWHLGDRQPSLPNDRGFQSFYGLLYSNDQGRPVVWRDRQIVEQHPIDQRTLTARYTEEALTFLEQQGSQPFFLFLSHSFPHVPLHASERFRSSSDGGLYGDVVEELDASVGSVVDSLERLGLARNTLVLVTSDNGPWFQGSASGTRGRKMDVFEGGMRVPFVVYWPGRIAAQGISESLVSGLDLLPTFLELAGLPLPEDRILDGVNLVPLLETGRDNPRETILYSRIRQFQAWRHGRYKYHARHGVQYGNPMDWRWGPFVPKGPWLFDLETDPEESYDITIKRPEIAQLLATELDVRRQQWLDNPRGWLDED